MNTIRCQVVVLALGALFTQGATADDNLWFGAKAGTLGLGIEATWRPVPYLDLRAGLNKFDYDSSGAYAGIDYNTDLKLDSLYVTANFRVPLQPLRFTIGIFSNGNELVMASQGAITNIGGATYLPSEIGTLSSTTSFESTAPYLGIGFDFRAFNKVGINLDLGVLWQDSPIVTMTADGTLAGDPTFDAALEMERLALESDLDDFKVYPVISLGFAVNF